MLRGRERHKILRGGAGISSYVTEKNLLSWTSAEERRAMKSNPKGHRWWMADMRKIGVAEVDAEDRLKWWVFVSAAKYQL